MGPVLLFNVSPINQPEIGFVDEGGGLQSVIGTLSPHLTASQPPQFRIHLRNQLSSALSSTNLT